MSDDYLKDEDLLSILEDSTDDSENIESTSSEVEEAMSESESSKIDTAVSVRDLKEIADKFDFGSNPGSGDLDTDLSNWFEGVDNLPSEGLNNNVSNASAKLDYGLTHNTLTSFRMMSKLRKFIEEDAFDLLFSESAILGLDSEDVLDRVKVAFGMYKELSSLTQRVVQSNKEFNLKNDKDSTDVDKLSLLLGSISSDKLQSILSEIAYNKKEDFHKKD